MGVYRKVRIAKCLEVTGRRPIATRWIDINKGDSQAPKYRSRLVAKEFNDCKKPELFAATPPGEGLKLLLSKLAQSGGRKKLIYADVSRAYFYAPAVRPVYGIIPEEDREPGDPPEICGELAYSMYGTRDAAQNWSEEYSVCLTKAGYIRGIANPCLFRHATRDVSLTVHGDDFVGVGSEKYLQDI